MPGKAIQKKVVKKVVKKIPKGPIFVQGNVTAPGIRYAGKDVFSMKITAQNARYTDMYEQVEKIKDKLATRYPNAQMNVAIKYGSIGKPISAGYFPVSEDPDLKAPYDYADDDDVIEYFYVSFVR